MNDIREYLGDSVYARFYDDGTLVLTTENGLPTDPSNEIILEPEIQMALDRLRHRFLNKGKMKYED